MLLYRTGLRISEALALRLADVDVAAGTIRVLHGKGDRARTVGVDAAALDVLGVWIERRQALDLPARGPLFCTLKGRPLATSYIRALMPRLALRAGIGKRVHAHGFRHTLASELRREGVDIAVISKQLGHATIATTSVYLDHIAPAEVVETIRRRRWHAEPHDEEESRAAVA